MATTRKTPKQTTYNTDNEMNSTTKTILTLAAGAVAGAVTALLLAPQSGAETRKGLRKTAQNLKEDLNSTIQQGIDKINSLRSATGDMMNEPVSMETGRMQTATGTMGTPGPGGENTPQGNTGSGETGYGNL